jgi:hypothetical protein
VNLNIAGSDRNALSLSSGSAVLEPIGRDRRQKNAPRCWFETLSERLTADVW